MTKFWILQPNYETMGMDMVPGHACTDRAKHTDCNEQLEGGVYDLKTKNESFGMLK